MLPHGSSISISLLSGGVVNRFLKTSGLCGHSTIRTHSTHSTICTNFTLGRNCTAVLIWEQFYLPPGVLSSCSPRQGLQRSQKRSPSFRLSQTPIPSPSSPEGRELGPELIRCSIGEPGFSPGSLPPPLPAKGRFGQIIPVTEHMSAHRLCVTTILY